MKAIAVGRSPVPSCIPPSDSYSHVPEMLAVPTGLPFRDFAGDAKSGSQAYRECAEDQQTQGPSLMGKRQLRLPFGK